MTDERRLSRIRDAMAQAGLLAMLVTGRENCSYLSGFTGSAGSLLITADQAWLLTDFRYIEQATAQAPGFQIVKIKTLVDGIKGCLDGRTVGRLGFEAHLVTYKQHQEWQKGLPSLEWVPTEGLVEQVRAVKSDEELAVISRAVQIADDAFSYILTRLKPGVTERQIAWELEVFMREHGAAKLAFDSIVASGPRGALPHARPSDAGIETGDLVVLDFGAVVDGYHSDMTRTVCLGKADARQREIYDLVLLAQQTGLRAVRPGRSGHDVDAEARNVIAQAGYGDQFGHGLGHGIGVEIHEGRPRLAPENLVLLEVGMVCSVEPGIYIPGWGGIRIEDLVVVTADGCRVLSQSTKELIEL